MPDIADDADERPIIFNDWSVRRILAGEKTQTRRIIDFDDLDPIGGLDLTPEDWEFEGFRNKATASFRGENSATWMHSPYGVAGDALWVREAFRLPATYDEMSPSQYVDEGPPHLVRWEADKGDYDAIPKDGWGRKRPSIHMPRELCRLRLRVEDVRVERVKEIDSVDAIAEGIADPFDHQIMPDGLGGVELDERRRTIHELAFKALWNDIHGDGAWERNDWVWVVEFSRIE